MVWGRESSTWHPPEWHRTRAIVRRRDQTCRWPMDDEGRPGEPCASTDRLQVDRRTPWSQGGDSDPDSCWLLCHRHHSRKTATESHASRRSRTHRDPPPHPSTRRRARGQ